jgi:hypothetical protein
MPIHKRCRAIERFHYLHRCESLEKQGSAFFYHLAELNHEKDVHSPLSLLPYLAASEHEYGNVTG